MNLSLLKKKEYDLLLIGIVMKRSRLMYGYQAYLVWVIELILGNFKQLSTVIIT